MSISNQSGLDILREVDDEGQENSFLRKTTRKIQQFFKSDPGYQSRKAEYNSPAKATDDVNINVTSQDWLSKLDRDLSIENLTGKSLGIVVVSGRNKGLIKNPFLGGLVDIVMRRQDKLYLKSVEQVSSEYSPMQEQVYEFKVDMPLVQKRLGAFLKKNRVDGLSLSMHFSTGNYSLPVLIRHVLLYDYYTDDMKDSLWRAMIIYVSRQVASNKYTKFHLWCVQKRIGNIRMYLVRPGDVYSFQGQTSWAAICNKSYMCNIQLEQSPEVSVKSSLPKYSNEPIFQSKTISQEEVGWLLFMLSIGNHARAFPIQNYLANTVMETVLPVELRCPFLSRSVDCEIFQKNTKRRVMEKWRQEFKKDLNVCEELEFKNVKKSGYMQPLFDLTMPLGCFDSLETKEMFYLRHNIAGFQADLTPYPMRI
ncbi:hypothetical protein POMI540_4517 [Schizosaccharomyces pombe]